jgi:hypothetical protein
MGRASVAKTKTPVRLADLASDLLAAVRELVGLPSLWGSAAARPAVEHARALLARAEGRTS